MGTIARRKVFPRSSLTQGGSDRVPSISEIERFTLPRGSTPMTIMSGATTLDVAVLGVQVPSGCRPEYRERFIAGFRHGLASNTLTDMRRSYAWGFCFAKCWWRKFFPGHRLAASGGFSMKNTATLPK